MKRTLQERKVIALEGFKKNAERLKLQESFLSSTFYDEKGKMWTVIGLNHRIRIHPVVAHDVKNRVKEFALDFVENHRMAPSVAPDPNKLDQFVEEMEK